MVEKVSEEELQAAWVHLKRLRAVAAKAFGFAWVARRFALWSRQWRRGKWKQ